MPDGLTNSAGRADRGMELRSDGGLELRAPVIVPVVFNNNDYWVRGGYLYIGNQNFNFDKNNAIGKVTDLDVR